MQKKGALGKMTSTICAQGQFDDRRYNMEVILFSVFRSHREILATSYILHHELVYLLDVEKDIGLLIENRPDVTD